MHSARVFYPCFQGFMEGRSLLVVYGFYFSPTLPSGPPWNEGRHAWFYSGGHGWFYSGGMGGFIWGGHAWFYSGGHAWFYSGGGMHGFFSFFGYNEIRSMSGWYASYWNAFLFNNNHVYTLLS